MAGYYLDFGLFFACLLEWITDSIHSSRRAWLLTVLKLVIINEVLIKKFVLLFVHINLLFAHLAYLAFIDHFSIDSYALCQQYLLVFEAANLPDRLGQVSFQLLYLVLQKHKGSTRILVYHGFVSNQLGSLSEFESWEGLIKVYYWRWNVRDDHCFAISTQWVSKDECQFAITVRNMPISTLCDINQGVNHIS